MTNQSIFGVLLLGRAFPSLQNNFYPRLEANGYAVSLPYRQVCTDLVSFSSRAVMSVPVFNTFADCQHKKKYEVGSDTYCEDCGEDLNEV